MKNCCKVLSSLMAVIMITQLAACGNAGKETSTNTSVDKVDVNKKYQIGVCRLMDNPSIDAATEGFTAALNELMEAGRVSIDIQNAQGDKAACETICNKFVSEGYDLILANDIESVQAAALVTDNIPILETSNIAPIDEQENMLLELLPEVKMVGILYCLEEPGSRLQATEYAKELDEDNIPHKEYAVNESKDIAPAVQTAIAEVDAIYIPKDNMIASESDIINYIILSAGIPVITGDEELCIECGIATSSVNYYDIGYKAGEMAYDILINGNDISTMKIESDSQINKKYNPILCEKLAVKVPEGYEAIAR